MAELLKKYDFEKFIYASGPGSFMGIKLSYLSLKTISIIKQIPLFGLLGFALNGGRPIRANKNCLFVLENGEICLRPADEAPPPGDFALPASLAGLSLLDELPLYFLDAI